MIRWLAVVGCAVLLAAPGARADDGGDTPSLSGDEPAPRHENSARVALVGARQVMFDLDIWGAGASVSFGREGNRAGGFGTFRYLEARTVGGLVVRQASVSGTAQWHWEDGWRVGIGGGLTYFAIVRATTGDTLQSLGPSLVGLVGYDFGTKPNFYVLATFEAQIQGQGFFSSDQSGGNGGGFVWGPTLETGLRF